MVSLALPTQVEGLVSSTAIVMNWATPPEVKVIDEVPWPPVIVPPVSVQLYVSPATFATEADSPGVLGGRQWSTLIEGVGLASRVTVAVAGGPCRKMSSTYWAVSSPKPSWCVRNLRATVWPI